MASDGTQTAAPAKPLWQTALKACALYVALIGCIAVTIAILLHLESQVARSVAVVLGASAAVLLSRQTKNALFAHIDNEVHQRTDRGIVVKNALLAVGAIAVIVVLCIVRIWEMPGGVPLAFFLFALAAGVAIKGVLVALMEGIASKILSDTLGDKLR